MNSGLCGMRRLFLECQVHDLVARVSASMTELQQGLPGANINRMVQEDPSILFQELQTGRYVSPCGSGACSRQVLMVVSSHCATHTTHFVRSIFCVQSTKKS